ncbi:hypothetical protein NDU88_008217 [Pleurodeles waltl]|uniref:Secreted protein n=1 Tax=Pleurodeles waltl TaxID=8319 RepID=A0AAV7RSD2_PLEWA|nr:hypothetical protein NDU88_008217 [Pleurodeles waltl]
MQSVVSAAARATRILLVVCTRSGAARTSLFLGVRVFLTRAVREESKTSRNGSWGAEERETFALRWGDEFWIFLT